MRRWRRRGVNNVKIRFYFLKFNMTFTTLLHPNITHFSMKGDLILKSAMKCQKNKFYVQIHAQEMIIYHRHKSKNAEFIPKKKLMVEVEEKKLMGKLNLSLTLIPSFCTFFLFHPHTLVQQQSNDVHSTMDLFSSFFRLALLLVKEICFPHSIHIYTVK